VRDSWADVQPGLARPRAAAPLTGACAAPAGKDDVTLNMSKGNYFPLRVAAPGFDGSA